MFGKIKVSSKRAIITITIVIGSRYFLCCVQYIGNNIVTEQLEC